MELFIKVSGKQYSVDLTRATPIGIPIEFNGSQPNAYGVEYAASRTYISGDVIGDVRKGGACNFESYTIVPHCNGTHTECIGHITMERISVHSVIGESLMPATLVSVDTVSSDKTIETYTPPLDPSDCVVTGASLEKALGNADLNFMTALVVRTLPNGDEKMRRDYSADPPPFFTHAAIMLIKRLGVRHLLVDFPSLDRPLDEGLLSNHRLYWNLQRGSLNAEPGCHLSYSITEMIYAPDSLPDGRYLLNLQFPAFSADAAPSKPVLYPITLLSRK